MSLEQKEEPKAEIKPPIMPIPSKKEEKKPKQATNPTEFAKANKESLPQGMLQDRDWLGIMGATLAFLATVLIAAANLWAVMYGQSSPYLASLTVLVVPSFFWYVKTLTGYDLNANAVKHEIQKTTLVKDYEKQLQIQKDILKEKDIELWTLKTDIAVKAEKIKNLEGTIR